LPTAAVIKWCLPPSFPSAVTNTSDQLLKQQLLSKHADPAVRTYVC